MKRFFLLMLFSMALAGCAFQYSHPGRSIQVPRENAAMQLTREGQLQLSAGHPDNAIRLFEQAIGLNPNDGQCYYYMAQAWLAKGKVSEARQFNVLARDYLKDDPEWSNRAIQQEHRIEALSK